MDIEQQNMVNANEIEGNMEVGEVLPLGWAWTTLGEICTAPQYGYTTSASEIDSGVKFLRITDLKPSGVDWSNVPFCAEIPYKLEKFKLWDGDIVIARSGSVGKAYLVVNPPKSVFASYLIRFRTVNVFSKYVAFFLQSPDYWQQIKSVSSGNTLLNVNAQKMIAIKLPLPPLTEQRRIVEVIEAQFTRLDAGVAALKRLQANLKRYKAAVLKAACEGRLVDQDPNDEAASVLLERILEERREKWAAEQRAKGKDPRKVKYEEPTAPDVDGLPELPEGWVWATVEQLCERIVDCLHSTPKFIESGFVCVDTNSIKAGQIVLEKLRYVNKHTFDEQNKRMKPEFGDVMFSREGALLGVAVMVPEDLELCIGQRMMIFRLNEIIRSKFYESVLNSFTFKVQYANKIGGSASPHLNISDIRKLAIPLPPPNEQSKIIEAIEYEFSIIDSLSSVIDAGLKRADRLRQAILREAFAGRLVAQDAVDEPASVLLERIRAEREGSANSTKISRKRGRNPI